MSSGARRDRDDRPRDWRDAHLSSGPSLSSKRKGGPDDRDSDSRGSPRQRSERRNDDRGEMINSLELVGGSMTHVDSKVHTDGTLTQIENAPTPGAAMF